MRCSAAERSASQQRITARPRRCAGVSGVHLTRINLQQPIYSRPIKCLWLRDLFPPSIGAVMSERISLHPACWPTRPGWGENFDDVQLRPTQGKGLIPRQGPDIISSVELDLVRTGRTWLGWPGLDSSKSPVFSTKSLVRSDCAVSIPTSLATSRRSGWSGWVWV